ncbi:hypothetical protein [Sorangium cellulosum]|uniref:Secreted protein n=1 Tax=Sorangium cellulosum TaxID=56 RepID=A0A150QHR1_SORCE|nr:hypothetical protein [Sorangium cellulosum]KYF67527.1 hypothetical protein BE15_26255 [Sorangium cellulosum]
MIRSSKSLALSVALGVIAAAGFTGCTASEPVDQDPMVEHERITQAEVSALPAGELLSLDMSRNTVYALDYSAAAIDYSRIKLSTADGKEVLLAEQMAAIENADYGDLPAPKLTDASDQRFSVSSDEAAFGKLSGSELDQLRTDGFFYSEVPVKSPNAGPQTTDPECIHAFCEICVDNETGGWPESWYPGTYTCYYIEHVWC